jgi:hypothetical protein
MAPPKRAASKKKQNDSSSEEVSKKRKRKKDPNAPKRPGNPYLLFSKDHREEAQKANPDLKGVKLTSVLSEMWNKADEETKQVRFSPKLTVRNTKKCKLN